MSTPRKIFGTDCVRCTANIEPVTAETAHKSGLNVRLVALGTVTPVSTVTVRSRVDGELRKHLARDLAVLHGDAVGIAGESKRQKCHVQ